MMGCLFASRALRWRRIRHQIIHLLLVHDMESGNLFLVMVNQIFSVLSIFASHSGRHLVQRVRLVGAQAIRIHTKQICKMASLTARRHGVVGVVGLHGPSIAALLVAKVGPVCVCADASEESQRRKL
uniref:Uncharacterized protein n=1 Tax=Favella ehrenbergii TaxID=182087 RepID=A0A7S3MLP6_9SPIT